MIEILNVIAGISGIISGYLWFMAAKLMPQPPVGTYYNVVDSPTNAYSKSWRKSTRFNQWGAITTGISALLFGIAGLFSA